MADEARLTAATKIRFCLWVAQLPWLRCPSELILAMQGYHGARQDGRNSDRVA